MTVVCEGKTERSYLERVNDEAGQEGRFAVHLDPRRQPGKGFKPSEAVERAVEVQRRIDRSMEPSKEDEDGDEEPDGGDRAMEHVWVVFDRDENLDIPGAMRRAREHGIDVAYSTPSFDLWLLLHFAPGLPPDMSDDNQQVVSKLNAIPRFDRYGKSSGGRASDSRPKVLNSAQLAELWDNRGKAVGFARKLVDRCSSGRCRASDEPGRPGHHTTCDPLKRDTQTDFYRLLELLGVDDRHGTRRGGT